MVAGLPAQRMQRARRRALFRVARASWRASRTASGSGLGWPAGGDPARRDGRCGWVRSGCPPDRPGRTRRAGLDERALRVLAFEGRAWQQPGRKAEAIREEFGHLRGPVLSHPRRPHRFTRSTAPRPHAGQAAAAPARRAGGGACPSNAPARPADRLITAPTRDWTHGAEVPPRSLRLHPARDRAGRRAPCSRPPRRPLDRLRLGGARDRRARRRRHRRRDRAQRPAELRERAGHDPELRRPSSRPRPTSPPTSPCPC